MVPGAFNLEQGITWGSRGGFPEPQRTRGVGKGGIKRDCSQGVCWGRGGCRGLGIGTVPCTFYQGPFGLWVGGSPWSSQDRRGLAGQVGSSRTRILAICVAV